MFPWLYQSQKQQHRRGARCRAKEQRLAAFNLHGPANRFLQIVHRGVALVHVNFNAALDHRAEPAHNQTLGRVLARQHFVEQNAKRVDVPPAEFRRRILLRRGVAGGAHDLGVRAVLRLYHPGNVKVDEHGHTAPQENVFRLDIPVYHTGLVQQGKGVAELAQDFPSGLLRQGLILQQEGQRVALDIFLQDTDLTIVFLHGINLGEMGAVQLLQNPVYLRAAGKFPVDALPDDLRVPSQIHAVVGIGF